MGLERKNAEEDFSIIIRVMGSLWGFQVGHARGRTFLSCIVCVCVGAWETRF